MILETPWRICSVPNGTGGCIPALRSSGIMDKLKERGVEWFFYYNVDNALIKIADPQFIGFAHAAGQPLRAKLLRSGMRMKNRGCLLAGWTAVGCGV